MKLLVSPCDCLSGPCENGGVWNGREYLCPEGLHGPFCQWQRSILVRGSSATTSNDYGYTSTSNNSSTLSATSTSTESNVTTASSMSSNSTVSFYTTSSSSSLSPSGFSTTTLNTGNSMKTFTELTSVFTTSPELSKSTVSSGTSSTWEDSAAFTSSPGHLSTTPTVSAQTDSDLTEGLTVYTGTPDLSKLTVTSDSTISKGDGMSRSNVGPTESFTSGTADSFSTHVDSGLATPSFAARSTFYIGPSELSTPKFPTHSSHSTDNASPASTSSPGELPIRTLGPGQADSTLTGETTILGTVPVSSEPPASSPVSHAPGPGSSGSLCSLGEAYPSPAVSGITSSTVPFKPTEYSILPGFSQPTGSSATTFTKEDRSSVSTSRSFEPFTTSVGDDQKTFPPGSTLNTIISPVSTATSSFHSSYSTDKTSPGFPSSPSELTHPSLLSEVTTLIVTEESILYTSVSDLSKSTVSSESSFTKFEGSSVSSSGFGHLSTTTGISQHTSLSLSDGSTVYTGTPDLSTPTVILDMTLSKESTSSASTSSSGETFPSTGGYQETPTSFTVESAVSTILSDSSNPRVPHDTFYTTHNVTHQFLLIPPLPSLLGVLHPHQVLACCLPLPSQPSLRNPVPSPLPLIPPTQLIHLMPPKSLKILVHYLHQAPSIPLHPQPPLDKCPPPWMRIPLYSSPIVFLPNQRFLLPSPLPRTALIYIQTSGGSTIFQSSTGIPNATISSNSSQTLVPGASSSASAIPGFSSGPVPDSSSALTTSSGFSPPLSSPPPGSTHAPVPGFTTSSTLHPLFTNTHTTVRMTQSSAMTPRQCQNGTIWNGEECVCAQGFFGYQCKSLMDSFLLEIPEKVNATLGVTVKVTNRNFTKDLNNISSSVYWNFTQLFKNQGGRPRVTDESPSPGSSNGSVVVEHDVIMEANYTSDYQKLFENLTKIIKVKIMNETKRLSGDSEVCRASSPLCYDEEATTVSKTVKLGFDLQEQCTQKAMKDYAQFSYVDELDGKLACVTKCTLGTKCPASDTHWYWGETCALSTSKSLGCGSVGAVGAVLVVTVVVLTVLLCRSQRKLHRQEYNLSGEWHGEDVPGSFQNTGIWEDTSHPGASSSSQLLSITPVCVWPTLTVSLLHARLYHCLEGSPCWGSACPNPTLFPRSGSNTAPP
ncbi:hypothetical protein GH733_018003 [Mirounga leonina]|nr:hypothetical protein GH733_018003 [Mirounga leonina]